MTCKMTLFLLAAVSCLSSGCAAMLPYGDAYDCPQMEQGRCISVESAHSYALTGSMPGQSPDYRRLPLPARRTPEAAVYHLTAAIRERFRIEETPSLVYWPLQSEYLAVRTIPVAEPEPKPEQKAEANAVIPA